MPDFKPQAPKHKPFYCSADWHICKSAQMICVYHLVASLTAGGADGRSFFASYEHVAAHFGFSYKGTCNAFKMLRKHGWLIQTDDGHHHLVTHEEWVKTHPNQCVKRDLFHWQETMATTDPLVARLYAASQGKLRMFERQVQSIHALGCDDEVVRLYVKELAAMAEKRKRTGDWSGTGNEACLSRVYKHLKSLQKERQFEEVQQTK
jgi:hypothetical protein